MTQIHQKPDHARETAQDDRAFLREVLRTEADAVLRVAERADENWVRAIDLLAACEGQVLLSGMGKSGIVAQKISATFASLGQPSHFVHPAEAVHGDLGKIRRGDVVILLSYSGETEEVTNLAAILHADEVDSIGISCKGGSTLERLATVSVNLGDIAEACPLNLAPTASTTAMAAVGDALALAVARRRNFGADDFHRNHPGGMLGVGLRSVLDVLRFKVGDNLAVVSESATVGQALEQTAADRRAGAIVLVDSSEKLSGIFTDSDFRRLMRSDRRGMERVMKEVMTHHPKRLTVDDLVRDAVRLVREKRLDEIPVVDREGKPVGLIDVQDLIAMKVVRE